MKKKLILAAALFVCTSCYDDYVSDYDYTTVYFFKQHNTRTVVIDEMMDIEFGVVLSGVLSNDKDRKVEYQINDNLVSEDGAIDGFTDNSETYVKTPFTSGIVTEINAMPSDWYTVSDDSQIIIPEGDHLGKITVEFDTDKFINAPLDTRYPHYVMPLEILSAPSIDYILEDKEYTLVAIVYESKLYGSYWHGGVTEVKDASGATIETLVYESSVDQEDDAIWTLETQGPYTLSCDKLSNGFIEGGLQLTLNDDNSITIEALSTSDVVVEPDGESSFNNAKLFQDRELYLKYKYTVDDKTYHATDTLTFRNRIRDGVTEWRDENAENYE